MDYSPEADPDWLLQHSNRHKGEFTGWVTTNAGMEVNLFGTPQGSEYLAQGPESSCFSDYAASASPMPRNSSRIS